MYAISQAILSTVLMAEQILNNVNCPLKIKQIKLCLGIFWDNVNVSFLSFNKYLSSSLYLKTNVFNAFSDPSLLL